MKLHLWSDGKKWSKGRVARLATGLGLIGLLSVGEVRSRIEDKKYSKN